MEKGKNLFYVCILMIIEGFVPINTVNNWRKQKVLLRMPKNKIKIIMITGCAIFHYFSSSLPTALFITSALNAFGIKKNLIITQLSINLKFVLPIAILFLNNHL